MDPTRPLIRPGTIILHVVLSLLLCSNTYESNTPPKLIVISFDGFRPDYVGNDTPNLLSLARSGVMAKHMKSSFGTKTFPNHMSIATGFYEETHGIVHNHMFDPVFNATFTWTNTETRWWDNGVSNPIWIANQRHNDGKVRHSGGMMWPGTNVKIRDMLPSHVFDYDHNANWNQSMDTAIDWLTDPVSPANLVMIYFDQPDAEAHLYGPFSEEVKKQIVRADKIVGRLVARLRLNNLFESTNLIILSDHGMSEIKPDRVIELNKLINRDLYDMHGASPLWNIIPKSGHEDEVYGTLLNASRTNHFTVYKKNEIPSQYHYQHNRRILPLVVVADDGYDIIDTINNLGEEKTHKQWGNHGYNNSLPDMTPLFIAHGPAFKEHLQFNTSFENVDLFPLMCYVLQMLPITHYPSNGTIGRVSDILRPIVRQTSNESILPMVSAFIGAFSVICLSGVCFVLIAGFGKRKKNVEINWDPGVTEFDFGSDHENDKANRSAFISRAKYEMPEEAVLLLDNDEEL